MKEKDAYYLLRKRAVLPAAVVLLAWQHLNSRDRGAWTSVLLTLGACELARFGAAGLFKSAPLEKREALGTHFTSLVVACYLNYLTLGADQVWSLQFPFIHSPEDSLRNVKLFQHEGHVLLTYLFLDTCHMLRNHRLVAINWAMIAHHALFAVIVSIGVLLTQAPRYQHISYLMLSAEFSTPFLNSRWIITNGFGVRWPKVNTALSLSFAAVFTLTRVLGYALLVLDLYGSSVWELEMLSLYRHLFAGFIAVAWCLNMYWFGLIISAARSRSGRAKCSSPLSPPKNAQREGRLLLTAPPSPPAHSR